MNTATFTCSLVCTSHSQLHVVMSCRRLLEDAVDTIQLELWMVLSPVYDYTQPEIIWYQIGQSPASVWEGTSTRGYPMNATLVNATSYTVRIAPLDWQSVASRRLYFFSYACPPCCKSGKIGFPFIRCHFLQWLKGSAEATVTKVMETRGVFIATKCGAISPLSALSYSRIPLWTSLIYSHLQMLRQLIHRN